MDFMKEFNIFQNKEYEEEIKLSYYIINYCKQKNIEITNLKLMKLLYFSNIEFMLEHNGIPLFENEFLAWRHGPVLQTVYNTFCYGIVLPTKEKQKEIFNEITNEKKNIVERVLKKLAKLDAWTLVNKTHIENGPWANIYNKYKNEEGICTHKIPNKIIYEFYKENNGKI